MKVSCREALKHLSISIECLKELASKVWFEVYFADTMKRSMKTIGMTNIISIWQMTKTIRKLLLTAFCLVLQQFTHTIQRIVSALSIAVLLHT